MSEEREFAVALPLEPLTVGTRSDRAVWPLHVTLVGPFRLSADRLDLLLDVVRRWSRASPPLSGTVRGEAMFGPGRDVHVDLVDPRDLAPAAP